MFNKKKKNGAVDGPLLIVFGNAAIFVISPDGRYSIAVSNASATGYTATATGLGDQANDKDGGVTCTLMLTVSAANPHGVRTPSGCWN